MASPVFMTVPKYVAISPNPLTSINESTTGALIGMQTSSDDAAAYRGKKRRLDHLSWEEKLQRKKLKNRVAAQTSRDRKKARMEEMEQTVNELTEQTEMLKNKCDSLQAINESLLIKNHKLDKEVEMLKEQLKQLQSAQELQPQQQKQEQVSQKSLDCVDFDSLLKGSAVSLINPLPQGMKESKSMTQNKGYNNKRPVFDESSVAALWKIVALCLLYKTCSKISTPLNWKSLPKVYSQISLQTWKEAIQKATQMLPKMKASQSDCLDQWWGPHQKSWNPANIPATNSATTTATVTVVSA